MEELQKQLHEMRKEIHTFLVKVDELKKNPVALVAARNLEICYTHLEDARMRLGKALEDTGSELPAQFADKSGEQPQAPAQPAAPADPNANANTQSDPANFSQGAQQVVNQGQQQNAAPGDTANQGTQADPNQPAQ